MPQDPLLDRKEPTDRCPKCDGDLTFRSPEFAGPVIEQVASCNACGLRLADLYRFVRAEALDDDTPGKETRLPCPEP